MENILGEPIAHTLKKIVDVHQFPLVRYLLDVVSLAGSGTD
jgi:hypothetical protein